MPALISTALPLAAADMNVLRPSSVDRLLKYPPGLGFGNLPGASMSAPSLITPQKNNGRRRSGSFTYASGSTYASGNFFHGASYQESPSRLGKRSAVAAGFNSQPKPQHRSLIGSARFGSDIQPPSRSPQGCTSFFDFYTTPSTKFDPFGPDLDEQPSYPSASSTSYSHYWEYDPSINGPKLRSTPPKRPSLLDSPRPRKIDLPLSQTPATSSFTPKPRSSPPTSPTYTPKLAPLSVPDKNARSKLLAGILLNRIHVVGKPIRRRLGLGSDLYNREYVKSGLSSVVTLDC